MSTPFRFLPVSIGIFAGNPRGILWLRVLMLSLFLHAAVALPAGNAVQGQTGVENVERAVKAAYLYKFLAYVEWPPAQLASAGTPFVIGVAGNDELASELERVSAGRSVNGRKLVVRRIGPDDSLAGLHLLYIGAIDNAREQQLLKLAQQQPILTVTDSEPPDTGAIINFRTVDNRVRFEVALGAAEKSGLQLSSRLLSVALKVRTGAAS